MSFWDYAHILTEPKKLSTQKASQGLQVHFDKAGSNIDNTSFKDMTNKDFYAEINCFSGHDTARPTTSCALPDMWPG
jgi:hypothetical protein